MQAPETLCRVIFNSYLQIWCLLILIEMLSLSILLLTVFPYFWFPVANRTFQHIPTFVDQMISWNTSHVKKVTASQELAKWLQKRYLTVFSVFKSWRFPRQGQRYKSCFCCSCRVWCCCWCCSCCCCFCCWCCCCGCWCCCSFFCLFLFLSFSLLLLCFAFHLSILSEIWLEHLLGLCQSLWGGPLQHAFKQTCVFVLLESHVLLPKTWTRWLAGYLLVPTVTIRKCWVIPTCRYRKDRPNTAILWSSRIYLWSFFCHSVQPFFFFFFICSWKLSGYSRSNWSF